MLIEDFELTMSHVGLGSMTEYALMTLFGNAHSHHLTKGRNIRPDEICDREGTCLYPAYFATHLKVPSDALLYTFKLWDWVSVGIDIQRFGDTLLTSRYILGKPDQIPHSTSQWDDIALPIMTANNLIVADASEAKPGPRPALKPDQQRIAKLEKTAAPPAGIQRSKQIRSTGFPVDKDADIQFESNRPFAYRIQVERDAAPGHTVMFAKFCEIMNAAEHHQLATQLHPPLPDRALHGLHLLEREIFYYGNCFADEVLLVRVGGTIERAREDHYQAQYDFIPTGVLTVTCEVYQQRDRELLAIGKSRKLMGVEMRSQDLASDIKRILTQLSTRNQQ